jgi:cobyrinic acid a,c-diamide synthase
VIRTARIVIAGTHSGVGKTTITTALIAALTRRGLRVQPFKVGPDFIDPGFHEVASGRVSRNLDGWMLSRQANLEIFGRACADADFAVIEGTMGLFDGRSPTTEEGSAAEMAKWIEAPVLLVADASAMARSAAALVCGFEEFDSRLDLAGVLFNKIGGKKHADLLREALAAYCRSTPVGFLPRDANIAMPSRHLGLKLACESLTAECLDGMVAWIEENVDLDGLVKLAREHSPELDIALSPLGPRAASIARIGVARDAAFCFYYRDNLDLLARCGAELVEFSPIADSDLPPGIDGLYLGGGYPEIHAARLSQNQPMLQAVRRFAQAGAPIYAECGGFMYLTEGIVEIGGQEHVMAGLFPTRARMQSRLASLGYVQPEAENSLWLRSGESLRGHQFRYSMMDPMPQAVARAYQSPAEGYRVHSVLGSYIHLHFLSCPGFAERFVEHCARWHSRS